MYKESMLTTNPYVFVLTGMDKYPEKILPLLKYKNMNVFENQFRKWLKINL